MLFRNKDETAQLAMKKGTCVIIPIELNLFWHRLILGNSAFLWEQPIEDFPLYALAYDTAYGFHSLSSSGVFESFISVAVGKKAMDSSCYQDIARTSAFVISMFAPLLSLVNSLPPVIYRSAEIAMNGFIVYFSDLFINVVDNCTGNAA